MQPTCDNLGVRFDGMMGRSISCGTETEGYAGDHRKTPLADDRQSGASAARRVVFTSTGVRNDGQLQLSQNCRRTVTADVIEERA